MNDSISREEVLRMIITAGEVEPDLGYTHLYKVIENLPSTESTRWIPCNERLPEEDGSYLVYIKWDYYQSMDVLKWADGWNCIRRIDGKVDRESEIDGSFITAWMPLPAPYREDGKA